MNELLIFYQTHGVGLTIIALAGVIVLGILKYAKVFEKYKEDYRHMFYVGISVVISLIAGLIYLLCKNVFAFDAFLLFAVNVFGLNQAFYAIFKATTLNDLITKVVDKIIELLKSTKK